MQTTASILPPLPAAPAFVLCVKSPKRCAQGVANLFDRQDRMGAFGPTFCDITWGAGGSTADLTLDIAAKMQNLVSLHIRAAIAYQYICYVV